MGRVFNKKNLLYGLIHEQVLTTLFTAALGEWKKVVILLQIEKAAETSGGDLTCYIFSLEDAVAHLTVTNPSGILTTEKLFFCP